MEPAHILPVTVNAEAVIGFDFAMTVELFADTQQLEPAPLDGCTITAQIGDLFSLSDGDGLTIDRKGGTVRVRLTSEQTGSVVWTPPAPVHRFTLRVEDGNPFAVCPASGDITFRRP